MYLFIFFVVGYIIPSIVLDCLQMFHIKKELSKKAVILEPSEYIKAGQYSIEKLKLSIAQSVFSAILFGIWIFYALSSLESFLSSFEISQNIIFGAVFVLGYLVINSILGLPFDIYENLILDKKYGFSKLSVWLFINDTLRNLALLLIIGGGVIAGIIYIMDSFSMWWIGGFILLFVVVIVANLIYPTIIAPLFNKFTPLEDMELQDRISSLMEKVGFKSSGIYVMDASRRDGRLNAYFGGLGKSKRVVLFDTLLDKISSDGLIAILGHELGHFKHNDLLKNIALVGSVLFALFFIAAHLPDDIFIQSQIQRSSYSTLSILLLISPIISFYFTPIMNYFSRKAEYNADKFGASLSSKDALANALIRLVNENKSFPSPNKAYVFFHYSHPPLLERLKALNYNI